MDFELFKQIVNLMKNKEHLTQEGLYKILSLKASLNRGLPENFKKLYPDIIPALKPEFKESENIDKNWIAGFVDAEGSFIVTISKYKTKIGFTVQLRFSIVQNIRDLKLISKLVKFLNCGRVSVNPSNSGSELIVNRLRDIDEIILPLFQNYNLIGVKKGDF